MLSLNSKRWLPFIENSAVREDFDGSGVVVGPYHPTVLFVNVRSETDLAFSTCVPGSRLNRLSSISTFLCTVRSGSVEPFVGSK